MANTLETGALVERMYAEKIRETFPSYEHFWSSYIGYKDDNGFPVECEIPNLADPLNKDRKRLGQWLYHSVVNILHLFELSDNLPSSYCDKNYLEYERAYLIAVQLIYHTIEQLEAITNITGGSQIESGYFEGFKRYRTMMIHYSRPFIKIVKNEFQVSPTDSVDHLVKNNPRGYIWSEFRPLVSNIDFVPLQLFITTSTWNLVPKINECLNNILKWCDDNQIPQKASLDVPPKAHPEPSGGYGGPAFK